MENYKNNTEDAHLKVLSLPWAWEMENKKIKMIALWLVNLLCAFSQNLFIF